MRTLLFSWVIAAALAVAVGVSPCWAGNGCDQAGFDDGCGGPHCSQCGCPGACAVCCLVKTEKEVKVVCYGVECKEICLARCGSKCACTECVKCGDGGCSGTSGCTKAYYGTGAPCCGKPKGVKQLVKYEMTKKVPAYKREVRYLCPACAQKCGGACCNGGECCEAEGSGDVSTSKAVRSFDQAYIDPPWPTH